MLIKTITCHDVYNHGASLQAYALMKYLQGQGHDVKIINYKPDYLSRHYDLLAINHPAWNTNIIKKMMYLLVKFPGRVVSLKRKRAFDLFTKKYLKLTPVRYTSNEQLKANPPEADIYICGSDQIWNCLFPNGRDPAFYLDFVSQKDKRKISYAPSFASVDILDEYKEFIKEKISRLDSISVRESSGLRILETLGIQRGVQVVDPVFLLDKEEWCRFDVYRATEKYLLVYDFEKNDLIEKAAITIARKHNLKIYSINDYKCKYADRNFWFADPEMFVSLIKHAEFVISNSFHATAFAIIFEKNFCVVNRSEKINTRMVDLLTSLQMITRLVATERDIVNVFPAINYHAVNSKLSEMIARSKQYLYNSINKEKGVV